MAKGAREGERKKGASVGKDMEKLKPPVRM